MTSHQHITSVESTDRVPFAARARVCWYRVSYFDPTSAKTPELMLAEAQETRNAWCPSRAQWKNLEATRARYLSDRSGRGRMKCMEVPKPDPKSLNYCLEKSEIENLYCVEDAFITVELQAFELPCKDAGAELRYGIRVVERAAEDTLPDMAACFYRVEYDEEVSDKLGSVGYGAR